VARSPMAPIRPDVAAQLTQHVAALATTARAHQLSDQDVAEWLLSLSARWLNAHGVARHNVQLWVDREMTIGATPQHRLTPLIAAAASRNDFGGRR